MRSWIAELDTDDIGLYTGTLKRYTGDEYKFQPPIDIKKQVPTSPKNKQLIDRLNKITGQRWYQNSNDGFMVYPIDNDTINSMIRLFPLDLWDLMEIGDDYVLVKWTNDWEFKKVLLSPYQLTNIETEPVQILEIKKFLDDKQFKFEIYPDRISFTSESNLKFPEVFNGLIDIVNTHHDYFKYDIPLNVIPLLHDYLKEDFPLIEPVSVDDIFEKFQHYLGFQLELMFNLESNNIISVNGEFIINPRTIPKEKILSQIKNVLAISFPNLDEREFDKYFKIRFNRILINNVPEIYHALWERFIGEPLIKSRLDQYLDIPIADLRNLVGEYYSDQPLWDRPAYQHYVAEPLQKQQLIDDILSSHVPIKDVRNLLNEYSDQPLDLL